MVDAPLILIVDDEANFREIFSAELSAAGFRVETAENGEQGIEKAKQLMPNLVLMDVKMPGMSGTDAAQKLQNDPATGKIKVVFLTSLGDPSILRQEVDQKFAESFGFGGYIKKTDDAKLVVERVKKILSPAV